MTNGTDPFANMPRCGAKTRAGTPCRLDWQQPQRQVHPSRRSRRRPFGGSQRRLEAWQCDERSDSAAADGAGSAARGGRPFAGRQMSEPDLIPDGDIFGDDAPPGRPRTEAEQAAAAEFEDGDRAVASGLTRSTGAFASTRRPANAACPIATAADADAWEATVTKAADD
jgi:hypothetical protein